MDKKTILITGAAGFVGTHLAHRLLENGHRVTGVDMAAANPLAGQPAFTYLSADTTQAGDWQEQVGAADVIINLAGKNIFTLWTGSVKRQIYTSRILTTRRVAEAISRNGGSTLISASAMGYYGNGRDAFLDETQPAGGGFLADVCREWEDAAMKAAAPGNRVIITRFGVVCHGDGGIIKIMRPIFRAFLGGRLGSGRQWFPWVHLDDLVRVMAFAMTHETLTGPVNVCAPGVVTNREFTRLLARALNRPALLVVPAFVLDHLAGDFGRSMLLSQKAVPAKLLKFGFTFRFPELDGALSDIT